MKQLCLFFLLAGMLWGCGEHEIPSQVHTLNILYSSNLNGELEPCGCTVDTDYGGIKRRASVLAQLRTEHPDLILVSAGGLLEDTPHAQAIKNQFILEGFSKLGYDAIGLQWQDLAFGAEFLQTFKLPWIASNYPENDFNKSQILHRDNLTLELFSLLDPQQYPLMVGKETFDQLTFSLNEKLKAAKQKQHVTLLLSSAEPALLEQQQVDLKQIDLLISPLKAETFKEPERIKNTLVLYPGNRGMRLGLLRLNLDSQGTLLHHEHEVIALSNEIADSPTMEDWYQRYNASLREAYEKNSALKKRLETSERTFLGAHTCQTCHQSAYEKWLASEHHHAFETLEKLHKNFDPGCVQCHVVGFNQEGGFIDKSITPQLANVQCENCHGPGHKHIQNPVENKLTPAKEACVQCHNHAHSPKFNFQQYWPRIEHSLK